MIWPPAQAAISASCPYENIVGDARTIFIWNGRTANAHLPLPFSGSPLPYVLLGLPSGAIPWSGSMGPNNLMVLYGRLGLVLPFELIMAIIAAPLLQRVWSPDVVIAQR